MHERVKTGVNEVILTLLIDHNMVKHTKTIRRLLPTNCLNVFDHFVGLALKRLTHFIAMFAFCSGILESITKSGTMLTAEKMKFSVRVNVTKSTGKYIILLLKVSLTEYFNFYEVAAEWITSSITTKDKKNLIVSSRKNLCRPLVEKI